MGTSYSKNHSILAEGCATPLAKECWDSSVANLGLAINLPNSVNSIINNAVMAGSSKGGFNR